MSWVGVCGFGSCSEGIDGAEGGEIVLESTMPRLLRGCLAATEHPRSVLILIYRLLSKHTKVCKKSINLALIFRVFLAIIEQRMSVYCREAIFKVMRVCKQHHLIIVKLRGLTFVPKLLSRSPFCNRTPRRRMLRGTVHVSHYVCIICVFDSRDSKHRKTGIPDPLFAAESCRP